MSPVILKQTSSTHSPATHDGTVNAVRQIQPCLAHRVQCRSNDCDATLFLGPEQDTRGAEQGDVAPDGFLAGRKVVEHDDRPGFSIANDRTASSPASSRSGARPGAGGGAGATLNQVAEARRMAPTWGVEPLAREHLLERHIRYGHLRVGRFPKQFQAIYAGQQNQRRCVNDPHEPATPSLA
jgi:hypothetical protein